MGKSVRAIHVGAGVDIDDIAEPGSFQFQDMSYRPIEDPSTIADGAQVRIAFYDPDGRRGALTAVKNVHSSSWLWDGNVIAPTLTPSIRNSGWGIDGEWHGYLTKGEFVSCS